MKKSAALFLALICALSMVSCTDKIDVPAEIDMDKANPPLSGGGDIASEKTAVSDSISYTVEIADHSHPVINALESTYKAGDQVTIQLGTVTEGYYAVYVNGAELDPDRAASDRTYTCYTFTMPSEDVLIEIESISVDIPHVSIPEFSFAKDSAAYKEGDPGVKTSGFVNTSEAKISSMHDADERAKKECTIEWNTARTYLDTAAGIWKVVFSPGTPGNCQSVYLDYDGKTVLIVYGE